MAARFKWGCSSVGRAPALQAGGHEFESHHLHSVSMKPYVLLVHWKLYIESKRILILLIIVRSIVRHPNYSIWFFKNRMRNQRPVLKACFYKTVLITSSGRSPSARKLVFERVLEKNKIETTTDWAATLGSKVWKVNRQPKLPGLPARTEYMVKLIRAQGGCLGTKSRWKTW